MSHVGAELDIWGLVWIVCTERHFHVKNEPWKVLVVVREKEVNVPQAHVILAMSNCDIGQRPPHHFLVLLHDSSLGSH